MTFFFQPVSICQDLDCVIDAYNIFLINIIGQALWLTSLAIASIGTKKLEQWSSCLKGQLSAQLLTNRKLKRERVFERSSSLMKVWKVCYNVSNYLHVSRGQGQKIHPRKILSQKVCPGKFTLEKFVSGKFTPTSWIKELIINS